MATTKLYVGGQEIGISVDDTDLEDAFKQFGHIAKIWVARKPPGFAFVEFEDSRDADDAVAKLDGTEIRGCRIRVEVSKRGERRAGGNHDVEMKPGDWVCPKCRIVNFARRIECFRCGEPKPSDRSRSRDRSYGRRDRYDRRDRRRSPSPRRRYGRRSRSRSRSPPRRRRSPSPDRRRRSPSPDRRRRPPSPDRRRPPSPDRRRSPSPDRRRRSPSPAAAAASSAKAESRSRSRSNDRRRRRRSPSASPSKGSGGESPRRRR